MPVPGEPGVKDRMLQDVGRKQPKGRLSFESQYSLPFPVRRAWSCFAGCHTSATSLGATRGISKWVNLLVNHRKNPHLQKVASQG
jgi:hypothetical protein